MVLETTDDGKRAASWGEGKKNCRNSPWVPECAFGWVLIGWALGRLLNHFPKNRRENRCSLAIFGGFPKGGFREGGGGGETQ